MTPSNDLPLSNNPVPTESTSAEGADLQHTAYATPDSVECDGHEKEAGRILNHVVNLFNTGWLLTEKYPFHQFSVIVQPLACTSSIALVSDDGNSH